MKPKGKTNVGLGSAPKVASVRIFTKKVTPEIAKKTEFAKVIKILERTQESVSHFYDIYTILGVKTQGAPEHKRQDLLRAMVIFACAGADIFLKQLIKDFLPKVIEVDSDAQKSFVVFVEKRLKKANTLDNALDLKFFATAISSENSRSFLLKEYEDTLINSSLQSADEILKIAAAFALKSENVRGAISNMELKNVFISRNNIIHEMDLTFNKSSGSDTKKRKQKEVLAECRIIFDVMFNFLDQVNLKVS